MEGTRLRSSKSKTSTETTVIAMPTVTLIIRAVVCASTSVVSSFGGIAAMVQRLFGSLTICDRI